jgi:hypothetical protein
LPDPPAAAIGWPTGARVTAMVSVALNTIAVVLLLAANAYFVAAEFALVRARRFRM